MITPQQCSKLAALVEGDPKAPFSIATTLRCNRHIRLVGRVFANSPGDQGSIPGQVIPKTQKKKKKKKKVLDTSLLNNQHYKIHIKGKME